MLGLTLPNLGSEVYASSRDVGMIFDTLTAYTKGIYCVSEFGAEGDGFTDDRAAIQRAVDSAYNAGGGVVSLPKGTFLVSGAISVNDRVVLCGRGRDLTIIKAKAGLTTAVIVGLQAQSVTNFSLFDLSIDGNSEELSGNVSGVQITDGEAITIRNVRVFNCRDRGILLNGCPDSEISGCLIENVGQGGVNGHGIEVVNGSHRSRIHHNRLVTANLEGMGIRVGSGGDGSEDCQVTNNYIDQSGSGLECIGVTPDCLRAIVSGNQVLNGQDNGISVSAADSVVANNVVQGANFHGIQVNGDNCAVTGNVSKNNNQDQQVARGGISLNNVTGVVVTGNRCYDDQETPTQDYGIKGSGAEGICLVAMNNFLDNKTAGAGGLSGSVVLDGNLGTS